ncbi:MAG: MATE family efflux transporter [Lentisphaerae bacterium]|nr:MATE family efflux transporter [Lentisphaerota bacterium]
MCHGPLFSKIILFSIPLIITNMLQLLFQATDIIVLGRFADAPTMASVGATSGLTVLVLNIFFGLSVGVNVLAARYTGARDRKRVSLTVHTAAAVAFYGGLAMAVIGILIARPALVLMETPSEILARSVTYLRIYCAGIPFIVCYNFGSSILRAGGDTRRPLVFMLIAGVVKVLLNLLFVPVLHLDVAGVGMTTLISNALSALLVVITLRTARDASRLIWKKIKIDGPILIEMLKIGLPAGIQGSFFSLSNVVIQASINSLGPVIIAGNTAAYSIESIVYVGSSAYYYTAISFVGQNHGSQKFKRIARSIGWCFACSFTATVLMGWSAWLFGEPLLKIYTSDPAVIEKGMIRMKMLLTVYFTCGFMDVISGSLRGLGHSVKPTIVTLMGVCFFRIGWVYWIFPLHRTMENLMISYPVSWTLVSVVNGTILFVVCRKMFRTAVKEHVHPNYALLRGR